MITLMYKIYMETIMIDYSKDVDLIFEQFIENSGTVMPSTIFYELKKESKEKADMFFELLRSYTNKKAGTIIR